MKKTIITICVAMTLAACNDVEPLAFDAIKRAKTEIDPVVSLRTIRDVFAEARKCRGTVGKGMGECDVPYELYQADHAFLVKAAQAGDPAALREIFEGRAKQLDLQPVKNDLKAAVLNRAKDSTNADLLATAAAIYADDTLGVISTSEQVRYLERAWAAGDKSVAGKLANIHARRRDYETAYFWSLRCYKTCNRQADLLPGDIPDQIELSALEKHLNAVQIASLQAEAAKDQDGLSLAPPGRK